MADIIPESGGRDVHVLMHGHSLKTMDNRMPTMQGRGGGTRLLLASVMRSSTTHPFRDRAPPPILTEIPTTLHTIFRFARLNAGEGGEGLTLQINAPRKINRSKREVLPARDPRHITAYWKSPTKKRHARLEVKSFGIHVQREKQ